MQFVLGLAATILSLVALTLYGVAILAVYAIAATADDDVCCSLGEAESVLLYSLVSAIIVSVIAGAIWIVFFFRIATPANDNDTPGIEDESGA
ncbi:hypothetical protein LCGC14_2556100 [marine sediment metagenome]|uniref:Uncharacterized protein n=1 Tax=marine sediment metagenome TaxID=412755 RepID=A0A0F9ALE0_9ZZZZ